MKELKEKELQSCTFRPNTNEGRNKLLIKEMLEDGDKENDMEEANVMHYQQ